MDIWVDADACPNVVKDILFRASQRAGVRVTLVANRPLQTPPSPLIRTIQVAAGFDRADQMILERLQPGDLVITADIPLASEALELGAEVLSPRGERFTRETIRERLTMRDFLDTLRGSGIDTGGPPPYGQRERQAFANALDGLLARAKVTAS
ncbi:DUF188 domain-containing protein [Thiocapsa imhoffii]|uniref:UPF0178 protein CKO25_12965 n=1 Tax=Thiocapsa imhoffii TaxID=382777 RepID=A0A9X0WJ73_9GAMM|nr:YaiI/YqxD family protein [Thiocapsa imhoffii]MBK1645536.1 DUF188 domain-containing protein [Thiocapsa imhoffii]